MMDIIRKTIIAIFTLITLIGCSASYNELKKLDTKNPKNFQEFLHIEYKNKAVFEAEEMHDWNSAKLYSEKALRSLKSGEIYPEKVSYWKIDKNNINEIIKGHESLISIYDDAKISDPYNLAKAIVSLDCWSEQQEEIWQTWDIIKCKEDFLNAMHIIYQEISKKNISNIKEKNSKSKDDATVITKNEDQEILQIIYFDFDQSELSSVSEKTIKKFIEKNQDTINEFLIVGHTDTKGSENYNMKLSLKRAKVVKTVLIENGVNISKIKIFGMGENSPAVMTPNETKHPANRRVEIKKSN